MKFPSLSALFLLITLAAPLRGHGQAPIRVAPPVTEVTLYAQNAAELRHDARPVLPVGLVTVRVSGMAAGLDPTTLLVDVGRGAELLSTEVVPADRPAALDSTARVNAAYRKIKVEIQTLTEEKNLLLFNRELRTTTAATWNADMARVTPAFRERMRDVLTRISAAEAEERRLAEVVSQLGNNSRSNTAARDVLLRLRVSTGAAIPLTVRYRAAATNTGWQPTLDLRVSDMASPLRAVSAAMLQNGTGVPWERVKMTLVNATTSQSVERPNLQPWTLRALLDADGNRRLERNDEDDEDAVGEGRLDGFATKGTSKGQTKGAAGSDSLRVESPLSDRFRLGGRVTVPANISTPVAIETLDLPMRAEYYVVPKLDPQVLLVAKVTGWQALRAPAARASVYLAGNYVGQTDLNTRAFNDSLEVALGADPLVVVSRAKRADRNSRNVFGSQQKTTLGYEINLRNDRPTPIRVRVADQIPLPLDRDITVTVTETSGATLEPESGRLTWVVSLKAGESHRLPFAFTVEAPAAKTLNLDYRTRTMKSPKFR